MATASSSTAVPAVADAPETLRGNRILSSKLYLDVPLSKVPLIYSTAYDISFLGMEKLHPFDSSKWGRICKFLVKEGVLDWARIVEPLEASKDDLLVVHSEAYLSSLKSSLTVSIIIEVPPVAVLPNCLVQQKVLYPFRKQVGGSILAAKLARERGWAINVGGGFHHCSAEKGGGFCAYADISLSIHFAFVRLNISRVMIIDLDAHQGNGHEIDFSNDRRVYILDMYNSGIYPFGNKQGLIQTLGFCDSDPRIGFWFWFGVLLDPSLHAIFLLGLPSSVAHPQKLDVNYTNNKDLEARRYIDQKVELQSGTKTNEYLERLDRALEVARNNFNPELVVYNAGTDILDGDPLGRLKVSPEGVSIRDEKVFRFARERNIPLLMLTSGGYMKSSARVIADSILNLSKKKLIDLDSPLSRK